jgi:hypothetical protein
MLTIKLFGIYIVMNIFVPIPFLSLVLEISNLPLFLQFFYCSECEIVKQFTGHSVWWTKVIHQTESSFTRPKENHNWTMMTFVLILLMKKIIGETFSFSRRENVNNKTIRNVYCYENFCWTKVIHQTESSFTRPKENHNFFNISLLMADLYSFLYLYKALFIVIDFNYGSSLTRPNVL